MAEEPNGKKRKEETFEGAGVSPGIATGPAFVVSAEHEAVAEWSVSEEQIAGEVVRFEEAIIATRRQIKEIQQGLRNAIGQADASIFDAHLMVLDDRSFIEDVLAGLKTERRNVETIVRAVARKYADALSGMDDEYLRERAADVKDVAHRVLRNLHGEQTELHEGMQSKCVVVAHELVPSQIAGLRRETVAGIATDLGSRTCHAAIMARSLEIPAVMGLRNASSAVGPGNQVIVDGDKGLLIVAPSKQRRREYGALARTREHIQSELVGLRDEAAETKDGHGIVLSANIELPADVDGAIARGAAGVGLFRSEYLYLTSTTLPSEEEQFIAYSDVVKRVAPDYVIIRTLDLGGDKIASNLSIPRERNPFMGWRAIRFCLSHPDVFKTQLRAILRASAFGAAKIMYPMICSMSEVTEANELLHQAKSELAAEGVAFDDEIDVGVMIETPSAALTSDAIAPLVDFFSLGTNDLIQYTLAVDRANELVATLYKPTHPAILQLIKMTIDAGHQHNIWVGVCGEMAADPLLAPLLVGLGVDELSVTPPAVPVVKDVVRSMIYPEAQRLAQAALQTSSPEHIVGMCKELIGRTAPEILELVR